MKSTLLSIMRTRVWLEFFVELPVLGEVLRHIPSHCHHVLGKRPYNSDYPCQKALNRVILEQNVAGPELSYYASQGPEINFLIVGKPQHHLGGPVGARLQVARQLIIHEARGPEIDDLDLGFSGPVLEEEILRFDIPVSVGLGVQVAHSSQNLLHISRYILLTEGAAFMLVRFFHDSVEKLAAGAKLHDQVDSPGVNECLVELHDVRMV
mmetsp:Transcript_37036/g.78556  ORF Transcript_37036/g.78556 Transcript_37036/m.78556 type:complete len:209 (+) Transcript_37036:231-857(+)